MLFFYLEDLYFWFHFIWFDHNCHRMRLLCVEMSEGYNHVKIFACAWSNKMKKDLEMQLSVLQLVNNGMRYFHI